MSYEQGALIEPLAVAVHAVGRTTSTVKPGSCVAILGAGPIGLFVAAAAFAQGARRCVMFDINEQRLSFAKNDYLSDKNVEIIQLPVKNPDDGSSCLEWAQEIVESKLVRDTVQAETIDAVFECTGVETSVGLSMFLVCRGGIVMLIGMGTSQCMMPIDLISTREIDVLGNFRYSGVHKKAIEMVSQGQISTIGLVTHKFTLRDAVAAYELSEKHIKIQIGDF